ncbi:MAG: copper amine oxidase N-terminal domain-containing protein, partial [Syntrophomonadaceae bacterium]|nr:copper amine oxidase N-terminal domain-containing protein [Syntrophomonadaceae bacterium]
AEYKAMDFLADSPAAILPSGNTPTIFINGVQLVSEQPAVIENDRTLVPLRAIFEALGQEVAWNPNDQSITSGDIWLQINNPQAIGPNNTMITLDVPAKIINDRTYVPLRFIAESLNKRVEWDGVAYRADILDQADLPEYPVTPPAVAVNPSMEFELTEVEYADGQLTATGTFTNTGDVFISTVKQVDVKIFAANDDGDSVEAANARFTDLVVNIGPGESVDYNLEITDVPEFDDATYWGLEFSDWEFEFVS